MADIMMRVKANPLILLLIFVPTVFAMKSAKPESHTLLFALSVLAIVPLAALLSHATESVAAKTGDSVGGLLNATLGNLTELVIALTALRAGQYMLVKASIAGAIVTNSMFMLGCSFFLGGLKYRVQEFNRAGARLQAGLLFLATVALLVPSAIASADAAPTDTATAKTHMSELSVALSILLLAAYGLGLWFSLGTHRDEFAGAEHDDHGPVWPIGVALAVLAAVTVVVALVSEIFVESVQEAAEDLGLSPAFVGFIVVALVGAAAEIASAFAGARKNRLDLSVGIALGSSAQIALFVAPVLVLLSYWLGPEPMTLQFWPGAVVMMLIATLTAFLVTSSGRSAWFPGLLVVLVYLIFAVTLYLLPPRACACEPRSGRRSGAPERERPADEGAHDRIRRRDQHGTDDQRGAGLDDPEDQPLRDRVEEDRDQDQVGDRRERAPQQLAAAVAAGDERPEVRLAAGARVLRAVAEAEQERDQRLDDEAELAGARQARRELREEESGEDVEVAALERRAEGGRHREPEDHRDQHGEHDRQLAVPGHLSGLRRAQAAPVRAALVTRLMPSWSGMWSRRPQAFSSCFSSGKTRWRNSSRTR